MNRVAIRKAKNWANLHDSQSLKKPKPTEQCSNEASRKVNRLFHECCPFDELFYDPLSAPLLLYDNTSADAIFDDASFAYRHISKWFHTLRAVTRWPSFTVAGGYTMTCWPGARPLRIQTATPFRAPSSRATYQPERNGEQKDPQEKIQRVPGSQCGAKSRCTFELQSLAWFHPPGHCPIPIKT